MTVNGANATATISSTALTYTLSGTITGPGSSGAIITVSGTSTASTTSSTTGTWSVPNLVNGTYTVAITSTGYTFTPATQSAIINGANATANASSTAQTYSLDGTISGAGGSGATVTLSGGTTMISTTANSSGAYSFTGVTNGSYTVTPTRSGYSFSPANRAITVSGANVTVPSFSTVVPTYSLSGTISGSGGPGATVTLSGAADAVVIVGSTGTYSFTNLLPGLYTVKPSRSGYSFSPKKMLELINASNLTGINFSTK